MRGSSVPTSCRNSSMSKSRLNTFLHSEPSSPSLPSNVKANRTRSTSFQRLNEEVATGPFWNRTAVTVFSRSVARKYCYRFVSLAKTSEFSTTFLSSNSQGFVRQCSFVKCYDHLGFPSLFSFGRYAGLPTAMRLDGDPANFPDIVLGPPKDGIYISVDRSGWMVPGCSH